MLYDEYGLQKSGRGGSSAELKILTNSLNTDTVFYKKGDDPT